MREVKEGTGQQVFTLLFLALIVGAALAGIGACGLVR